MGFKARSFDGVLDTLGGILTGGDIENHRYGAGRFLRESVPGSKNKDERVGRDTLLIHDFEVARALRESPATDEYSITFHRSTQSAALRLGTTERGGGIGIGRKDYGDRKARTDRETQRRADRAERGAEALSQYDLAVAFGGAPRPCAETVSGASRRISPGAESD